MNVETFDKQARKLLNNYPNPENRISAHVQAVLNKSDFMIDTHMHIFDFDALPPNYFIKRQLTALPNFTIDLIVNLLDLIILRTRHNKKEIDAQIRRLLRKINLGEQTEESILIMEQFFLGEMKDLLDLYLEKYVPANYAKPNKNVIVTPLMMDMEPGWGNKANKNYFDQINEVKLIGKDFAILPFVNLDPRRLCQKITYNNKENDIYDIFIKAFSTENMLKNKVYNLFLKAFYSESKRKNKVIVGRTTPFFGVKIYPILGYLPSDERLAPIFSICEEFNIPITTHLGGTLIIQNPELPNETGLESGALNQPELWLPVLDKHKKLRLNIGHFGGTKEWELIKDGKKSDKIEAVLKLMEFENVYADVSYIIAEEPIQATLLNFIKTNPTVLNKTLYGTDYWMLMREKNFRTNIMNFYQKATEIQINGISLWKHISQLNPVAFYGLNENINKHTV